MHKRKPHILRQGPYPGNCTPACQRPMIPPALLEVGQQKLKGNLHHLEFFFFFPPKAQRRVNRAKLKHKGVCLTCLPSQTPSPQQRVVPNDDSLCNPPQDVRDCENIKDCLINVFIRAARVVRSVQPTVAGVLSKVVDGHRAKAGIEQG